MAPPPLLSVYVPAFSWIVDPAPIAPLSIALIASRNDGHTLLAHAAVPASSPKPQTVKVAACALCAAASSDPKTATAAIPRSAPLSIDVRRRPPPEVVIGPNPFPNRGLGSP
jgi:hypothetical protein